MKKLISFFVLTAPLLCFGMKEPSNNRLDADCLTIALKTDNIPLINALVQARYGLKNALIYASKEVIFDPEEGHQPEYPKHGINTNTRQVAVPLISSYINDAQLQEVLEPVARNHSLETTKILLEQHPGKFTQQTLNNALAAALSARRRTLLNEEGEYFAKILPSPIFVDGDPKATKQNASLVQLLESHGATLSPEAATAALNALGGEIAGTVQFSCGFPSCGDNSIQMCSGCDSTRRESAQWLIRHGGRFQSNQLNDATFACVAPGADIDQHCVGKSVTAGSVLGHLLGCVLCLPCRAIACIDGTKNYCQQKKEGLFTTAPAPAIAMNAEPERQPALLTNN